MGNIRFNESFIHKEKAPRGPSYKVFLKATDGNMYSRKEVEAAGIADSRNQQALIASNHADAHKFATWKVSSICKLASLLGTSIENLVEPEDYNEMVNYINERKKAIGGVGADEEA